MKNVLLSVFLQRPKTWKTLGYWTYFTHYHKTEPVAGGHSDLFKSVFAVQNSNVDVSCGFLESCVLPCAFTPGDDPVIHWTKEPEDIPVYNYFKNRHQLHIQNESYTGRTSLSDQGISTGDASLQLHKVKVHDEGRYKCYVNTIRPDNVMESFVNLKVKDNNVTCILNQTCTLPCPFQGEFTEAYWRREDSTVPIIVEPPGQWHLHLDYRNIASMPEGGAALEIRGVQLKHQGLHRCSVTSRTGTTDRFVYLNVHAPVTDVSVHQEGQELICRAERIYPEPTVVWSPPSSDSSQTQTVVHGTEDGLYSVSSSVRLPPNSAAESLICNISTPYSWRKATVPPQASDNLNHRHHWTLLFPIQILILILVLIPVTVVVLLMFCYRLKRSRSSEAAHRAVVESAEVPLNDCKMTLEDPKMSLDDESLYSAE